MSGTSRRPASRTAWHWLTDRRPPAMTALRTRALVACSVGGRGRWVGDFDDDATLDAVVARVSYVQVALGIDDDASGGEELAQVTAGEHAAVAGARTRRELVDWCA